VDDETPLSFVTSVQTPVGAPRLMHKYVFTHVLSGLAVVLTAYQPIDVDGSKGNGHFSVDLHIGEPIEASVRWPDMVKLVTEPVHRGVAYSLIAAAALRVLAVLEHDPMWNGG